PGTAVHFGAQPAARDCTGSGQSLVLSHRRCCRTDLLPRTNPASLVPCRPALWPHSVNRGIDGETTGQGPLPYQVVSLTRQGPAYPTVRAALRPWPWRTQRDFHTTVLSPACGSRI